MPKKAFRSRNRRRAVQKRRSAEEIDQKAETAGTMHPGARPANQVSLDSLRTLLAFYEEGGVSAAAKRLEVSQPVVSRKLDALTKTEPGGPALLRRENGTLQLTEAAKSALPSIREIVRKYEKLLEYLCDLSDRHSIVSLGAGHFAAEHYIPCALAILHDELPDCAVITRVLRGSDRILGTYDGHFDIAIVSHDPAQVSSLLERERGLQSELVVEELTAPPLVVIAQAGTSKGDGLSAVPPGHVVPVRSLSKWQLVGLDAMSGVRQQLEGRVKGLQPDSRVRFVAGGGGWTAAREFARRGLGVAIVPLPTLRPGDERELTIRPLGKDFRLTEYSIHRGDLGSEEDSVLDALQQAAWDTLEEAEMTWRSVFR